ncbi:hypothetical protein FA13DRAFT_1822503 [Coprinellus micaceus]|uniref:DUF6533 domain-containing protein n=1 Tax=Coprinellus micaceus TaxID=71717 RepID=A0A4Y7S762_COPMI|nr:hypothetical protein FA13DRAFT_1822503 [Coprinellus micaceus]
MYHDLTTDAVRAAQLVNYFSAAGMAIMIADYLHTLPQEVRLVWPTKMSIPKLIFLLVRYGNFLFAALVYLYALTPAPVLSSDGCRKMFIVIGILEVSLSTFGEAIIYIRVWAFAGCDRKVLYILASIFLVLDVISFSFLGKYVTSVEVFQAAPSTHLTCVCIGDDSVMVSVVYGIMVVSVVGLMAIMVGFGIYRYQEMGIRSAYGGLLAQFYRDGIIYFVMLLVLNVLNIAIHVVGKHGFQYLLVKTQIYLHGMIAVRMVLHLRAYAEKDRYITLDSPGVAQSALVGFVMPEERIEVVPQSEITDREVSRSTLVAFP